MAASNHRNKSPETIHHLVSRIAHRVYFLEDDQRSDFLEYMRRATAFSGLTLIGWCIMANHFHILVYLPTPETPDEQEVVRRYGALKGGEAERRFAMRLAMLHARGEEGERAVAQELDRLRKRMYRIDEYMRIIKQWFSEEYNARNGHKGTMWESVYRDTVVPDAREDMRRVLGYIHLNPVRAAATDLFDGYAWSSFSAFRRGDALAATGMRFVYGQEMGDEDIYEAHAQLLGELLEEEKLRRAQMIARLRAAGCAAPCDPLTDEAMVAQAEEQMRVIQREALRLSEAREAAANKMEAREAAERQILSLLEAEGPKTAPEIARMLDLCDRTVRRYLVGMKSRGLVSQSSRFAPWTTCVR